MSTLLATWLAALETRLLYVPTAELALTPAAYGLPYRTLDYCAEDGVQLMAWSLERDAAAPWLIYFHGNGENISRYLSFTAQLYDLGLNVLMPEYRGYGLSAGTPSEAGLYRDAQAAYRQLRARGVPAGQIVLYGFSLGSAVAVELARREPVAALVLEAPFTSIPEVAKARYWVVPPRLVQSRFASVDKIGEVDAPLLVLHSPHDMSVPYALGRALYGRARGPKRFVALRGHHAARLTGPLEPALRRALVQLIIEHGIDKRGCLALE